MSEQTGRRSVELGDIDPARSRHAGRRSAVALTESTVFVGTTAGEVRAFDRDTLAERWQVSSQTDGSIVAAEPLDGDIAVGERGPSGEVRCYDAETGALRWRYATAEDVGEPQRETRFFLPFVAALASDGDGLYAAVRRYERDGEARLFESAVYAVEADGTVAWRFETDASPIALDADGDRVAVAYNRCPGDHQQGLVVLDAETAVVRYDWDPGTDGQRRVGDVSLVDDGVVVASHGDYRGYRLRDGGREAWCVDLATPTTVDDEELYAYPNHAHATADGAVFVTGNTYSSSDGRETNSLHPHEHTAFGYASDGERVWTTDLGGFAGELAADGARVAVPGAQHFRRRDADAHGLHVCETSNGPVHSVETDGIVTAVSLVGDEFAAVEEPVVYHDEGDERGHYRLFLGSTRR